MPQEATATSQELTADGGGSINTSTGFATGTKCTSSGTYRSSTKYMDIIAAFGVGDEFPPGSDGKKTTWVALTSGVSTNKDGSFTSVKVEAGTV
jgi:hypothetical protein